MSNTQKQVEHLEVCKKKPLEDKVVAQQILLILLESDRVAEAAVLLDPCCFNLRFYDLISDEFKNYVENCQLQICVG